MRTRAWAIATVLGMLIVVSMFVATTLIVRRHSGAAQRLASLAQNGAPSVRLLGQARGDVRNLRLAAQQLESDREGLDQLRQARQELAAHLTAEQQTPLYPGEAASTRAVDEAVARLDGAIARLAQGTGPAGAVVASAEVLDHRLELLHDLNAAALERDAARLVDRQGESLRLALWLDLLGLGVAALVTAALVHLIRRQLALEAERCLAAEAQAKELNAFSGRVAHDLMSPLATVALALAGGAGGDGRTTALAERALRALNRTRGIVEDLLNFSRSGGYPSPNACSSVPEVVAGVVDELEPIAELHRIQLTSDEIPDCAVACEAGILSILMTNLVNNAIKFMGTSVERRIFVHVKPLADRVRFEIADTGPGLPPGFEAIAFNPYRRAQTGIPGLGIGLATVKRLAVAHGGNAGVVSEAGAGSTFWFELPRVTGINPGISMNMEERPTV